MNLSMKQTQRQREQTCGCQRGGGLGEGWIGNMGLGDTNYQRMDNQQGPIKKKKAQGTIFNIP